MTEVKLKTDGFKFIDKSLKDNYKVRVGILGSKGSQSVSEDMDMAGLGAVHEFGSISRNIPRRSFLQDPLENKVWEFVKKNADMYYKSIKEGTTKKWYQALATEAEAIVQNAFETSGDGEWQANSEITIKRKGSSKPLIDTGSLRRSIASEVTNDSKRK